jgi:hypothetical protein
MPIGRPATPEDPWWYRAMEPIRSEDGMFRLLLAVVAVCAVIIGLTLLVRAVF